jgi:hypothetical protein
MFHGNMQDSKNWLTYIKAIDLSYLADKDEMNHRIKSVNITDSASLRYRMIMRRMKGCDSDFLKKNITGNQHPI